MSRFYVTFGQKYRREAHPALGAELTPDHWVTVEAPDELAARREVIRTIGQAWSMLHTEEEFRPDAGLYPKGEFARLVVGAGEMDT